MTGRSADARTRAREACFLDLAKDLVGTSPLPLMLTGGITRRETAEKVLTDGVALVGMGTALAVTPDLPDRRRKGREADRQLRLVNWSDKTLASAAGMAQVRHQMRRIARGSNPVPGIHPARSLIVEQLQQRRALPPLPRLAVHSARRRRCGPFRVSSTRPPADRPPSVARVRGRGRCNAHTTTNDCPNAPNSLNHRDASR
jgi:hypothetical protein